MTKPELTQIMLRIPADVVRAIDALAESELTSRSAWMRRELKYAALRHAQTDAA